MIIRGGVILVLIDDDDAEIPGNIQSTYIQQSSYWLTFFPLRGFLAVFDLAQVVSLILVFLKTQYVVVF